MKPKFSLQSVLNVRHSRVEALEIELGKLMQTRNQNQALLETLLALQVTLHDRLRRQENGEMDIFMIQHLHANIEDVNKGIVQVRDSLAELAVRIEAKRQELVAAKQSEETLTILKGKEYETFRMEQRRLESASQDDLYIAREYQQRQ
ncbi:MAG: flagellar FliJ family protein [Chloroflexi bacterium]|nr:flagellar FliJ family protein [Chloroflexota bacterium]